ncbi:hypothetical protein F4861DRAFT_504101 [Xylaria intraflava]|nr:hypothetical protein F4861DRAFT_504101 [Xylaria intraflava]
MARLYQIAVAVAALAALIAAFFASSFVQPTESPAPPALGKNGTVLFFMNAEYGLSNVHLATAGAIQEKYPCIDVHIASFPRTASKVTRASDLARRKSPGVRDIHFHELPGPEYMKAFGARTDGQPNSSRHIMHAPGTKGLNKLLSLLEAAISPWEADDHIRIFQKAMEIIDAVDPAIVVLDTAFKPTVDATQHKNRLYAYLTPNILADAFFGDQPYGGMFWKYPRMGTGFSFPLPWWEIPQNVYITARYIYTLLNRPTFRATRALLKEHGIPNLVTLARPDRPWISQDTPGASIPLEFIPPNVTRVGPITVDDGPAMEQDPELASWLSEAPTILINLGSLFTYTEEQATTMALAIAGVLAKTNVQVLWKMAKETPYSDTGYTSPVRSDIEKGRLRITNWLSVSPVSILGTGHVVASVHHGGANCYHESIAAGTPQVIIPMWLDLYNYAQMVEDIGVGVYATRGTAPEWTAENLRDSFLRVIDGGEDSVRMRNTAKELGESARKEPGRLVAAREIVQFARSGCA